MSTSCLIGVKVGDKIESIRCHWDGYPRGKNSVGEILKTHYSDLDKIASLMALGDISSLGYEPVEDLDGWNPAVFSCDHTKCVAYRTRGETDIEKRVSDTQKAYAELASHSDVNFVYLYKDGEWHMMYGNPPKLKKF